VLACQSTHGTAQPQRPAKETLSPGFCFQKTVDNSPITVDKCELLWTNVGFTNKQKINWIRPTPHPWGDWQILTCILKLADEKRNRPGRAYNFSTTRPPQPAVIHIWCQDKNLRLIPQMWGGAAALAHHWGVLEGS
jgi:hypothetical protein